MIQKLESRVLLAATYASNVLTVTGTNGDDLIRMAVLGDVLSLYEGGQRTGSYYKVQSIIVKALDGRDHVMLEPSVTVKARFEGGNQADTLHGGSGPDVLLGQGGHDVLYGHGGIDALIGGSGDDLLDGGLGNDYLEGGDGSDHVTYAERTARIEAALYGEQTDDNRLYLAGEGGQLLNAATGEREFDTYAFVERLTGGRAADELRFLNNAGRDSGVYALPIELRGWVGDDYVQHVGAMQSWKSFNISLYGGDGNDTLEPSHQSGSGVFGEAGNDTFRDQYGGYTGAGATTLVGGSGRDTLVSLSGLHQRMSIPVGSSIEDAIVHMSAWDGTTPFRGNELDNHIILQTFDHAQAEVLGGPGNDRLTIMPQFDTYSLITLRGEAGNDVLYARDFAGSALEPAGGPEDYLDGGAGDDALFGYAGNDTLIGGDGNDYLEGMDGNDSLVGGIGNDTIRGGLGIDRFEGNAGNDVFYSRNGDKDYLYGGSGTDSAQRDAAETIIDSVEKTIA